MESFVVGIVAGIVLTLFAIHYVDEPVLGEQARAVVRECEKELPRNRHCRAYVVAEEVKDAP